jgi:ATP-dependent DNA helicase PIF1
MNNPIELSHKQKIALVYITRGKNILIHGCAGTGKSMVVKYAKKYLQKKYPGRIIATTASTGVSAINIGGSTIHWFSGIRTGKGRLNSIIKRILKDNDCVKRWKEVDTLIIDEISMISQDIFEKLDGIGQIIRENSRPFGGIQLILLGDFYQLTPVEQNNNVSVKFCFESPIWSNCIDKVVNLTKIFRQTDSEYKEILNRIRKGRHTIRDILKIKSRIITSATLDVNKVDKTTKSIKLYPLNKQVALENQKNLVLLSGIAREYKATYFGYKTLQEELKKQFISCDRDLIKLKIGARVMLTYNLNVEAGLCNGSLGTIIGFKEINDSSIASVVVKFDVIDNKDPGIQIIDKQKWDLDVSTVTGSKLCASVIQIPLVLAFAASIHKAQGLTFSKAEIDLNKCFAEHQIYVALSRVKTLDGLILLDNFSSDKIKVNKKVVQMFA